MEKNKITENVVWENLDPNEREIQMSGPSFQFNQPQKTFCYKCGKLIPADAAFCPWCQIELHTTCPKCQEKYSSEYPSCPHCGTNKEQYIQEQKRLEAIRQRELEVQRRVEEERRMRMEEERRRQEAIRQRELEAQRRAEEERRRKEEEEMERRREEERRRQAEIDARMWQAWKEKQRRIEEFKNSEEYKETLKYWTSFIEYNSDRNQKMFLMAGLLCFPAWVCEALLPAVSFVFAIISFIACLGLIVFVLSRTSIFGSISKVYESFAEENPCPEKAKAYVQKLSSSNIDIWNLRIKKAPEQVLKVFGYDDGPAPSTGAKAPGPAMYRCNGCGHITSYSYIRITQCPSCKSYNMDIYHGSCK